MWLLLFVPFSSIIRDSHRKTKKKGELGEHNAQKALGKNLQLSALVHEAPWSPGKLLGELCYHIIALMGTRNKVEKRIGNNTYNKGALLCIKISRNSPQTSMRQYKNECFQMTRPKKSLDRLAHVETCEALDAKGTLSHQAGMLTGLTEQLNIAVCSSITWLGHRPSSRCTAREANTRNFLPGDQSSCLM